ncbi:MAG: DNA repair protein RadA, partial [Planctomycetota bacterium]
MAKTKIHFLCKECGSVHPKWMGKCPDCGAWDVLEEFRETPGSSTKADPFTSVAPGTGGPIKAAPI